MTTNHHARRKPRLRTGLAIALILSLLITLTLTVFASSTPATSYAQGPEPTGDPLFAALIEAGMIEPLNFTQAMDGVTVTLAWVYADVNTLAVHYTVDGLPPLAPTDANSNGDSASAGGVDPTGDQIPPGYIPITTLSDSDGAMFAQSGGQIDPRGETGNTHSLEAEYTYYSQALTPTADGQGYDVIDNYFTATYGANLPDRVALVVSITLAETSGGDLSGLPGPNEPVEGIGPFEFTVEVPVYRATGLDIKLTQVINDLDVTLERVELTPVQTSIWACYDLPDGGDWHPLMSLTIEDEVGRLQGFGLTERPGPDDVRRCARHDFAVAFSRTALSLTVTVDALRTSIPETREYWEAVRDGLAEHDIVIDVVLGGGRYYDMIGYPDDMTQEELGATIHAVQESLLPTVEGPWIFVIGIP